MSKKPPIWELVDVQVKNIKFNPDNPKIPNEKGLERLRKSLEKFGHIFDGIINSDFSLIDGHSRIAQLDEDDYAAVFMPDRKLSKKEYNELSSIFDIAVAGDPDFELILDTLGEESAIEWGLDFGGDYSERNKEIDTDGISSSMTLVFHFDEEVYYQVIDKLNANGDSFEDGLLKILKL